MKPRDKLRPSKRDAKVCKVCIGCQRRFYVQNINGNVARIKYCSRKCMKSATPRICKNCGMMFMVSKKSKRKTCGNKCPATSVTYSCTVCKVVVTRPRCFGYGKYCSFDCRRNDIGEIADWLPNGLNQPIQNKHNKRVDGDMIDKYDVFEFYNWVCIVCDNIIDKNVRWPDPMSATLEHVIPLGRGGTHTWDNVAPAHLLCNGFKGDELDEDLIAKHQERWVNEQEWYLMDQGLWQT